MIKFLSVIIISFALFIVKLPLGWSASNVTDNGDNIIIQSEQDNILIDITAAGNVIEFVSTGIKVC